MEENTAFPGGAQEIREIRLDDTGVKYRLRIKEDQAVLDECFPTGITRYTFPAAHRALADIMRHFVPNVFTEDSSGDRHEVTYVSGEKRYIKPVALEAMIGELISKLWDDRDNISIENNDIPVALAGAVAYKPLSPSPGMGSMEVFLRPGMQAGKAALNPDGSWDCACGMKGLTCKFCYECGAPRPQE